jgi:hypothetical protein
MTNFEEAVPAMTTQERRFLFNFSQFLGHPKVLPPAVEGKTLAAVQFIVPGLKIGKDKPLFLDLAKKCGSEVWAVSINSATNERTKEPATVVEIGFYVEGNPSEPDVTGPAYSIARILIERFVAMVSFFAGVTLVVAHPQVTTRHFDGHSRRTLPAIGRAEAPKIKFLLSEAQLKEISPQPTIFSALFWLRRGLAERDALETFSALMVCLQILARDATSLPLARTFCPSCGAETEAKPASISAIVHEYVVGTLGESEELFNRMWKARNAVTAHGNKDVTPEVLLELTELKFDAANLCYKGVKLALGLDPAMPPNPDPSFFATDALMYMY